MNQGKWRRREFRKALKAQDAVRVDRFTEMMQATLGGGTIACASCTLLVPDYRVQGGICEVCRNAMKRIRVSPPAPKTPTPLIEPNVVYVDASFRGREAGLAVVGALGEHHRRVEAASSTQAESLALYWAIQIARKGKVCDLIFRTDCQSAYNQFRWTGKKLGWAFEQIPRRENAAADRLAWNARVA